MGLAPLSNTRSHATDGTDTPRAKRSVCQWIPIPLLFSKEERLGEEVVTHTTIQNRSGPGGRDPVSIVTRGAMPSAGWVARTTRRRCP